MNGQITGAGAATLGYASGSYDREQDKVREQRAAEIPHELDRLERTLKGCEQGLEVLIGRLEGSVMRCEPPSPVGAGQSAPTAVPQTPYGSRLQELVNRAALMNYRVEAINARLEV